MGEFLTALAAKFAGTVGARVWNSIVAKFQRPNIHRSKAPINLLDHIKPSASEEHVRELLGPPHQIVGDHWFYRFSDALVQVEYWPDSGAKSIALGLVGTTKSLRFPVPGCQKPLGQLSIADIREEQDTLRYRRSLRHEEILVETRLGPTGAWNYWTFGAMMAVGARVLHESLFEWDNEAERLKTSPELVLINWLATSNSSDEVYFDWSMG